MRKGIIRAVAACFVGASLISINQVGTVMAATDFDVEVPIAGVTVALNNFYASNLNPEDEIKSILGGELPSSGEEETPSSTQASTPPQVKEAVSPYANIAISRVSNYVNVRNAPNTEAEVVGKIYNNCAATILDSVDGEGGEWYHIKSGSVTGYIKAEYFTTGSEAEKIAKQVGTVMATISGTASLRLRDKPSLESKTLTLLSEEAEYVVLAEEGNFVKLAVDSDLEGYVSADYVKIRVDFDKAVSVEEEKAKLEEENRRKREAEEAEAALKKAKEEAKKAAQTTAATTAAATTAATVAPTTQAPETEAPTTQAGTIEPRPGDSGQAPAIQAPEPPSASTAPTTTAPATEAPTTTAAPTTQAAGPGGSNGPGGSQGPGGSSGPGSSAVTDATRNALVAYAKQFLGNSYVYGGTSLTNGTDCSGFTMGVYAKFGISIGRSSRDQAAKGKEISIGDVQPGDLLFYASGNYINHVAMYIGGGQVIHASSTTTGIIISPSNYRTPCKAVTFLD